MTGATTADLFSDPPIARRSDPVTSKTAAHAYSASQRGKDQAAMLELVEQYPGKTAGEYAEILIGRLLRGSPKPAELYKAARMPTKRLSDLSDAGDVRVGEARKCRLTKRPAQTYYPVRRHG